MHFLNVPKSHTVGRSYQAQTSDYKPVMLKPRNCTRVRHIPSVRFFSYSYSKTYVLGGPRGRRNFWFKIACRILLSSCAALRHSYIATIWNPRRNLIFRKKGVGWGRKGGGYIR